MSDIIILNTLQTWTLTRANFFLLVQTNVVVIILSLYFVITNKPPTFMD